MFLALETPAFRPGRKARFLWPPSRALPQMSDEKRLPGMEGGKRGDRLWTPVVGQFSPIDNRWDDSIGKGHCRQPRHEREGQVRPQPGDTRNRLALRDADARLQVHGTDWGQPRVYQPVVQRLRVH